MKIYKKTGKPMEETISNCDGMGADEDAICNIESDQHLCPRLQDQIEKWNRHR